MGLQEVSNILWRERQLLELLLFKLECEQVLLASGRTRWLSHATREAEMVLEQVRLAELARAVEVESLAAGLRLDPAPSLRQLRDAAPDPWKHILDEHRKAFLELTQEIQAVAEVNRELLARGQQATREALSWLGEREPDLYSPTGVTTTGPVPHLVDRVI